MSNDLAIFICGAVCGGNFVLLLYEWIVMSPLRRRIRARVRRR
jgi:hypothetical protein